MKTIYLTGFMGAGKTTVGKRLAEKTGLDVIDTDEVIMKKTACTIEEIFQTKGENHFRALESEVLFSLPTENVIITTGGGMVLKDENRAFMKKNGIVIFLYCSPENIFERLQDDDSRPLLKGDRKKEIKNRLEARMDKYREADYIIDTNDQTVEETVDTIIELTGIKIR